MNPDSIGFIGLGNLGTPIARNLIQAGRRVRVYNRTRSKTAPLVEAGAVEAGSVEEIARACPVVISLVSDDQALDAITRGAHGLAGAMPRGAIHLSLSTVSPRIAGELHALHQQQGSHYVASPVLGRPEAAMQKTLVVCVAGDPDAKKILEPLWPDLGASSVRDFGTDPAQANVVKLCVNFMLASMVESASEAFALAHAYGVDPEGLFQLLGAGIFNTPAFKNYGRLILDRKFQPASFTVTLGLKDISLVLEAARGKPVSMEQAKVVRDRLEQSVRKGRGAWDFAAFSLIAGEGPSDN